MPKGVGGREEFATISLRVRPKINLCQFEFVDPNTSEYGAEVTRRLKRSVIYLCQL